MAQFLDLFKPKNKLLATSSGKDKSRGENVDLEKNTKNIFQNHVMYFQRCKELEGKVEYMEKLNSFLISQVLQNFDKKTPGQSVSQKADPTKPNYMKIEDDRSLNRAFQLYNIFKKLLQDGGEALGKIASTFFPENFDFESALYSKNHLTIINLLLKASINSFLCLSDELDKAGLQNKRCLDHRTMIGSFNPKLDSRPNRELSVLLEQDQVPFENQSFISGDNPNPKRLQGRFRSFRCSKADLRGRRPQSLRTQLFRGLEFVS